MMSMNVSDIAILNIKGSDYCCIISLISKNEAINLFQNDDLSKKQKTKKNKTKRSRTIQSIKNLFSCMKMSKEILTFGNIEI